MDVIDYLRKCSNKTREFLFQQPYCCIALYKSCNEKERTIISRLLSNRCHYKTLLNIDESDVRSQSDFDGLDSTEQTTSLSTALQFGERIISISEEEKQARRIVPTLWSLDLLSFNEGIIELNRDFRSQLFKALSSPTELFANFSSPNNDLNSKSHKSPFDVNIPLDTLIKHSQNQWESMIIPLLRLALPQVRNVKHFSKNKPSKQLQTLMQMAGLMNEQATALLSSGYTFLLNDIPTQMWTIVHNFLDKALPPAEKATALSFLMCIAMCVKPGQLCSFENIEDSKISLLIEWNSLGLIYIVKVDKSGQILDIKNSELSKFLPISKSDSLSMLMDLKSVFWTPTPMINQVFDPKNMLANNTKMRKWWNGIIVESNFYVYAYTDSSIMISIIELFCQIVCRLPNMCVARMTRSSVRAAFKKNIHAEHIIQFLNLNKHQAHQRVQSHTELEKKSKNTTQAFLARALAGNSSQHSVDDAMFPTSVSSGLPEQVEDQLRLWEEERFRFSFKNVVWWEFEPEIDDPTWYSLVKQYALDYDLVIWFDDEKQSLCVKQEGQSILVDYYRTLNTPI